MKPVPKNIEKQIKKALKEILARNPGMTITQALSREGEQGENPK